MGDELDYIGRPGWRLYDRRCFGYLAIGHQGRPMIASYDRAQPFPTEEQARAVAATMEPERWAPVAAPQPPQVGPITLTRRRQRGRR